MPEVKTATVQAQRWLTPGIAEIQLEAAEDPGLQPGQYLVARTTLPHPERAGDVVKRAWSPARVQGRRFSLIVAAVGASSRWLAEQQPGVTLSYSGPWGRFLLDAHPGPAAFFATGTGLSPVGELLDGALAAGRPATLYWQTPAIYHEDRLEDWRRRGVVLRVGPQVEVEDQADASWFLAGDGACIEAAASRLSSPRIYTERFFTPRPAP